MGFWMDFLLLNDGSFLYEVFFYLLFFSVLFYCVQKPLHDRVAFKFCIYRFWRYDFEYLLTHI